MNRIRVSSGEAFFHEPLSLLESEFGIHLKSE